MVPTRLVLVGSVVVDVLLEVPHLPRRGGDVLAGPPAFQAGGGFNVLAAALRLGLPCALAGRVGAGPLGAVVRRALEREGVELLVPVDGGETGLCIGLVEPDAERTFVTSPGVEAQLRPADLDPVRIGAGDAVYLSGYDLVYPTSAPTIMAWLERERASMLVFDPGPLVYEIAPDRLQRAVELAAIVTMGAVEAAAMPPSRAAIVILRRGDDGCTVTIPGGAAVVIPPVAVNAVDTTGAGDAHTGALLALLARTGDLIEAARGANAAAAYALSMHGSATGPTTAQLEAFVAGRVRL